MQQQRAIILILCFGILLVGNALFRQDQPEPQEKPRELASQISHHPLLFNQPLNINQATLTEIQGIPGIGPVLAQRIVHYRQENGPFTTLTDLTKVQGIGDKTVKKLGPYCTTSPKN